MEGARRRPRWGVAALVLLLHLLLLAGLIRAFRPDIAATAVRAVTQALTVELEKEPPPPPAADPSPNPTPSRSPDKEAASGAAGKMAVPRDVVLPKPPVATRTAPAAPTADKGTSDSAGSTVAGPGVGGAAAGTGAGSGRDGAGRGGGGGGAPTVKIAGDINSARDYPRRTRDLRVGSSVVIDLQVGPDGRVSDCRVVRPSPDPDADRITCDLAARRFRFRPATNASGEPIPATYRWQQRWFY